jgi:hypothetical protein
MVLISTTAANASLATLELPAVKPLVLQSFLVLTMVTSLALSYNRATTPLSLYSGAVLSPSFLFNDSNEIFFATPDLTPPNLVFGLF